MQTTVENKIVEFLDALGRSRRTIITYQSALKDFVSIVGDDAELNKSNYATYLKSIKHQQASTQRVKKAAVRGLYRYCESPDYALLENQDKIHLKPLGNKQINFDEGALEKFVNYCINLHGDTLALRDKAFVLTLRDTGLRIAEACALRRGDIDLFNLRASIIGKGEKQAVIRFSPVSLMAIKAYHEARQDGKSGKPINSLPVFSSHHTDEIQSITPNGIRDAFNKRAKEAGIDEGIITPHTLRHYFVTAILLSSGNLKLAKDLARHSSVSVTQRYAHLSDTELDKGYKDVFG